MMSPRLDRGSRKRVDSHLRGNDIPLDYAPNFHYHFCMQGESKELLCLKAVGDALTQTPSLRNALQKIQLLLSEILPIHGMVVGLLDSQSDQLNIEFSFGYYSALSEKNISVWKTLMKKSIESDLINIVKNIKQSKSLPKEIHRVDFLDMAYVCLPIQIGAEMLGALSFLVPTQEANDLDKFVHLVSLLGVVLGQDIKLKRILDSEKESLKKENELLKVELKEKYNIQNMVGSDSAMREVYEQISQVADSNATVLIRGESGTGKELVAHAIHFNSSRARHPFVRVNCGAIPDNLLESELFGYEKGAFTDAQERKLGRFEIANNGTVFLDEIGELPLQLQVKLLRAIQEKEIERVGGVMPIKINVRIIAATNRNLEEALQTHHFREDLYYRLNVFPIWMPPLRERHSDILLLANYFLEKFAKENRKSILRISSLAIDLLNSYHWPGNVRELENCMERAVLVCKGDAIQASHLPPTLQRSDVIRLTSKSAVSSLEDMVSAYEKELIEDALTQTKGHQQKAATLLHTTTRILGYKIQKLDIDLRHFKK